MDKVSRGRIALREKKAEMKIVENEPTDGTNE
jgi:hypothetical protein